MSGRNRSEHRGSLLRRQQRLRAHAPRDTEGDDRWIELLVRHRWATVVPIVLPLSKGYGAWWRMRHVYWRALRQTAERHDERVRSVQRQIREWDAAGRPGQLCTSRSGWQTVSARMMEYKKSQYGIDIELHDILSVDLERKVVRVEPRVNMAQLTRALVPLGYTLPVVPELDDLTVGGLFLGYGIEASSHKYGLFADTVRSAELVLANGEVVTCSATERPEIFRALPWSYGSLGMLTALELPLIECESHVRVRYEPFHDRAAFCDRYEQLVTAGDAAPELVEGLMYDHDRGVILVGEFASLPPGETDNPIGRWYKPWFYKHAEVALERGAFTEYLPLRDWYHRHTRSMYWHGELLVPFGNHPAFRYPLGWLMPPKVAFMKLTQTEAMRRYREKRNVVQDFLVPIEHMREGIEVFHRELECYPLWLCAHRMWRTDPPGLVQPPAGVDDTMYVDLGAWQVPGFVKRGEPWDGTVAVERLEAWARAHDAYQCLYAVTEQSEEEFWQMFHREPYERARAAAGAEGAFLGVYDKVRRR